MNYFAFALFAIAFLVWCGLHLAAAYWAVKKLRYSTAVEIDMNFVRVPDFSAREVRAGRRVAEIHAKAYSSFPKSVCEGVVFSEGDCLLRSGTQVGGVVSTGLLAMKDRVLVRKFADSQGEMTIRKDCRIGGPATSATAIRLGSGSGARSLHAPEITTEGGGEPSPLAPEAEPALEIPLVDGAGDSFPAGFFKDRLKKLSADTWIYQGDLTVRLLLRSKLVVIGSVYSGPHSVLEEDLKATGDIQIGSDSICKGKMVSDGSIRLGDRLRFEGVVCAAGDLRLGDGIRGGQDGAVVAYAQGRVLLNRGILIRGKIASGVEVVCLPDESA